MSIGLNVNVGDDKGNGTYTYDFRSVESLAVTDTGGKEASEGDPFAIPDLPPLSRCAPLGRPSHATWQIHMHRRLHCTLLHMQRPHARQHRPTRVPRCLSGGGGAASR